MLAIALAAAVAACANTAATRTTVAFDSIEMIRTACLGACPDYSVSVTSTGTVTFTGRNNVAFLGTTNARLSAREMKALASAISSARHLFEASEAVECPMLSIDAPETSIRVISGEDSRTLSPDYSCNGPEVDQFHRLAEKIDRIAATYRWVGRDRD